MAVQRPGIRVRKLPQRELLEHFQLGTLLHAGHDEISIGVALCLRKPHSILAREFDSRRTFPLKLHGQDSKLISCQVETSRRVL